MRIIVFSDSHGGARCIAEALMMHPEAQAVIHLGDGERDMAALGSLLEGKRLIAVSGNCDLYSDLPAEALEDIGGVRILCTHGHRYGVKSSDGALVERALKVNARILLYGHTHEPVTRYEDGLYIMIPGSARQGRYGMIDITPNGIACILCEL